MDQLQSGSMLGHYRLIEKIGEGGMGVVWKAEDTRLGRAVAVKVLPRTLTDDPDRRQRFQREAKSVAALNHPNISVIHEIGEEGNTLFIVMELVAGRSLRARIDEGPLAIGDLLSLAIPIARALSHAHAQGIAHRDLKPDNVMITPEGEVKLLDFGLAKPLRLPGSSGAPRSVVETITANLSHAGSFAGTVGYMSPEMARGLPVDARTDQFSFGVVLYEMATGQRPFRGENWAATLARILETEPELPTKLRPDLPPALERIVLRCLNKEPEARYPDCRELARELEEVKTAPAAAPSRRPRAFWKWGIAAVLLIALVALALTVGRSWVVSLAPGPDTAGQASDTGKTAVAVLPFTFRGDGQYGYLGEGMVNLLGAALDGAGPLRSADARAILGASAGAAGKGITDLQEGRSIAGRLGAGQFILGDIVEAGGKLRIQASVYDTAGGAQAGTRAEAEGTTDQVFEMVDSLAAQILAARTGGLAGRVTRVAAVTTRSIPALKAYLQGEALFRAGRFAEAVESFQRAVGEDPSFALAYYRLSIAAEWGLDPALTRDAAEKAVRHTERLSAHDRLLLEALLAWRQGDTPEAERLYRNVLGHYPDDLEAWFQMGEVLFHGNPLRGRHFSESREPFERVLSLEPDHVPSLLHLARIASFEDDSGKMSRLENQALRMNPEGEREMEARGMLAYGLRDRAAEERLSREARRAPDDDVIIASVTVPLHCGDPAGSAGLVRTLTDPARSPETRVLGHLLLAQLEAAQGRPGSARFEIGEAARLSPAWGLEFRAQLATIPFLPVAPQELDAVEEGLSRFDAAAVPPSVSTTAWVSVHNDLHPSLRLYLQGAVAARRGRQARALESAAAIERLEVPQAARPLASDLARSLRAHVAVARGETGEALRLLMAPPLKVTYSMAVASPFVSRVQDRWLLAGLLESAGRYEEALGWYGTLEGFSVYDLPYLAPSHLRRGRICEQLGRKEEAAAHYRRFLDLWRDPDPGLNPLLDEAKTALARIQGK